MGNPFDRFDAPLAGTSVTMKTGQNPFDRFDVVAEPGIDFSRPIPEVRAAIARLPEDKRQEALKQWATAGVAKERQNPTAISMPTPKFPFVNEIAAGIGSGLNAIANAVTGGTGGPSYDELLTFERERDRQQHAATPIASTVADIAQGFALPLPGPGASMAGTIGKSAAAGGGYGAVYGAGEGDGLAERGVNAVKGAAIGGALGMAAPPLAKLAGNVLETGANLIKPNPPELAGVSRKAIRNVLDDANADRILDPNLPTSFARQAARLGDDGMLADMGANLQEHAGGLATKPGVSSIVARPIMERAQGAADRLETAVSGAMGSPRNVPEMIANLVAAGRRDAAPLYDQFYATTIKPTDRLVNLLQRVPKAAYERASQLMEMEGLNPNAIGNTGRMIDLIKRGLDDVGQGQIDIRGRTTNLGRVYNNLARDLTSEVDRILSPQNPALSSWAQARKAAGDNKKLQEAFESGQKAFSKSLSHDQMAYDMRGMSLPEQTLYKAGARTQIHEVMDTASNRSGSSAATAGMRTLGSSQADKKLRDLAVTPESAANLSAVRDAEANFANTTDSVLRNSKTAVRSEQGKRYQLDANDNQMHNLTLEGMVAGPLKWAANVLTKGAISAHRLKAAEDAARMLIAQGTRRDEIVRGLLAFQNMQATTGAQRTAAQVLVNRLMFGARGTVSDAMAEKPRVATQ